MSIRLTPLVFGSFFHVYNRGTDKRVIFLDTADYQRFLELLYLCNSKKSVNVRDVRKTYDSIFDYERGVPLVSIGAYCVMPNHFHMLLTSNVDEGISHFLGKLCTAYAMYFNKRYVRTGALFQGKFKSEYADTDEYLKYLFSYIHLNPVKLIQGNWKKDGIDDAENAMNYLEQYRYSSFSDYTNIAYGGRIEKSILNKEKFPEYFPDSQSFKKEIFEWIEFDPNTISSKEESRNSLF